MADGWGPWIEHDGKGCPCIGWFVEIIFSGGEVECGIAGEDGGFSWHWDKKGILGPDPLDRSLLLGQVWEYRIRKPRGMVVLEALLQDLPQEVGA